MIFRRQLHVAAISYCCLVAACTAQPQLTSSAPGRILEVSRTEPETSSFLIVAYTRPVQTNFWIFAEDAIDFRVGGAEGAPLKEVGTKLGEETVVFINFGPDLVEIGGINGLPVALHGGSLLVGKQDMGKVNAGDTIEFTREGIRIAGKYVGPVPQS